MKTQEPFKNFQPNQVQESKRIVSVTELAWAVSRILNFVHRNQKNVWITKRGHIIAAITPTPGNTSVADRFQERQDIEG